MFFLSTKWLFPEIFHFKAEMNWEVSAEQSVTSKTGPSQENWKVKRTFKIRYQVSFIVKISIAQYYIFFVSGMGNIDDQYENPNMNNKHVD